MTRLRQSQNLNRPNRIAAAIAGVLGLISAVPAPGAVVASWGFETPPADLMNSTTFGPIAADIGTGQASGLHAGAGTDWSTPSGNGSANSLSSNEWAVGDYYQFTLSLADAQGIIINYDQTRSTTGPALFDFAYSTDGTLFTVFENDYTVAQINFSGTTPNAAATRTIDLSAVAALNNAPSATFRLVAAAVGSAIAGTNRVDNFIVNSGISGPAVASLFYDLNGAIAGIGGAGNGTWDVVATNWNTDPAGTAQPVAFDPAKQAVFGGTSGTVQIAPEGVNADAGVRFDVDGYLVKGGTLTLGGTTGTISVVTDGHRATIAAPIGGTAGLTKTGAGTLVLSGSNFYTGTTTIAAGILSIATDMNLGVEETDLALTGGTLRTTADVALNIGRTISGSGGRLDIAPATTLILNGSITTGAFALTNTGTLDLKGAASLGAVTFAGAGTLTSTAATQTTILIGGDITSSQVTGTTTISTPISFGNVAGNARRVTVADGPNAIDMAITGPIALDGTGVSGRLHKLGAGTLELSGDNSLMRGARLGTAQTGTATVTPAVTGGTLRITNRNALGGASSEFQFNAGKLEATTPLTGANALPMAVTIGANAALPATFTGSNIEFAGSAALFGNAPTHKVVLGNTLTFAGGLNKPVLTGTATDSSTSLTVGGIGRLVLATANTFDKELIVEDTATVFVSGSLSASKVTVNSGTFSGNADLIGIGDLTVGNTVDDDDAILAPGDGIGTLRGYIVTLESDAVLRLEINSDLGTSDRITTLTRLVLNGDRAVKLDLSDLGSSVLSMGTEFTLINNAGTEPFSGRFAGTDLYTFGANEFELAYNGVDGNDLVLRVIPEPAGVSLLAFGSAMLGIRRRSRSAA